MATEIKGIGLTADRGWQVLGGSDLFNNRLERLIFQKEGGLLGNPDFGSLVLNYLADPDDRVSQFDIINEISILMQTYEPDLSLIDASVSSGNEPGIGNVVTVKLTVEYTLTDQTFQVEFFKIRDII